MRDNRQADGQRKQASASSHSMRMLLALLFCSLALAFGVPANQACASERVKEKTADAAPDLTAVHAKNLALGAAATASGTETGDGRFTPDLVVDGVVSAESRWSGAKRDEQWLLVDLRSIQQVSEFILRFESQCPSWELQTSIDGTAWNSVHVVTDGPAHGGAGDIQVSCSKRQVRYIRYVQHKMWRHTTNKKYYSSSIYELEAYESIPIEKLELTGRRAAAIADSFKLKTTVVPAEASHAALVYTTSNPDVATVDENGTVTGRAPGSASITVASAVDSSVSASVSVRIAADNSAVFSVGSYALSTRDRRYLTYEVIGKLPHDAKITYRSADGSVASVDARTGLLSAIAPGATSVELLVDGAVQDSIGVQITAASYAADYDTMKDRWIDRVTGGPQLDLSDRDVRGYVAAISREGEKLWKALDTSAGRTRLWPKVSTDTVSADYTTQFTNIKKLAVAFGTKGSRLYHDRDLLADITNAIRFMVESKSYNGTYSTGNWWDWQIGSPQPLCDTLMIISDWTDDDAIEAAIKAIEGYCKSPAVQWPNYVATGANRTDIGLSVLGSAIVAKNDARMGLVDTEVPDVMKLVTSGDGFYADGSVIQHTAYAYTGSYGNELIKGIGKITSIIANTRFEISDPRIDTVYHTIDVGFLPLMHKGQELSMVSGRSISRAPGSNSETTEFATGSETISNVLLFAQSAPEPYATKFKRAIKGWLEAEAPWRDRFDFFSNARDFDALLQAKRLMSDDGVVPSSYSGMRVYGSMDRVLRAASDYTAGISMYSSRIFNYEYINKENARGWHTGDGMLYIYNNDLDQFGEGFWPTVDAARLAGTTSDTRSLVDGAGAGKKAPQSWVGGATDGENGSAGMLYNASNLGLGMNLQAKKSWFMFPGRVVCLGADISGSTSASLETTIENRMITDHANHLTLNGVLWSGVDGAQEPHQFKAGDYAHFSGTGAGNDLGYVFLQDESGYLEYETRQGTYAEINKTFPSDKVYTNRYLKMGIDHGRSVKGGSYGYMILPGASERACADAAARIKIVSNTADVQAAFDRDANAFGMNTWSEQAAGAFGLTVDTSASVFARERGGKLAISIADPKHKNTRITVRLRDPYDAIASLGEHVSANADGSFTIDTTGLAGASSSIVLSCGDRTDLEALVKLVSSLDANGYTPDSWNRITEPLAAARALLARFYVTQNETDDICTGLKAAYDQLVGVQPVNPNGDAGGADGPQRHDALPGTGDEADAQAACVFTSAVVSVITAAWIGRRRVSDAI